MKTIACEEICLLKNSDGESYAQILQTIYPSGNGLEGSACTPKLWLHANRGKGLSGDRDGRLGDRLFGEFLGDFWIG